MNDYLTTRLPSGQSLCSGSSHTKACHSGDTVFFLRRKISGPLVRGSTPGEQFLRFVLLIAVFVVTGWLFWINAENSMEKIESRGTVVDLGDALSTEQRQTLRDLGALFTSEYGMKLKVVVSAGHLQAPAPDGKTMYFGVNPQTRRVEIQLPPLVGSALGPEVERELAQRHIVPGFANNTWPQGLVDALKDLWQRLDRLQSSKSKEYRFPVAPETPQSSTPADQESTE